MTPRRVRDTDPNSHLRRRIAFEKLYTQLEEYRPHREEMLELSPPECQTYLTGEPQEVGRPPVQAEMMFETDRAAMDIPQATMPCHNPTKPSSEDCMALYVPEDELQMVKYHKAVEQRAEFKTLTDEDRFMVSCPSPLETWKMEKEYADYTTAALLLKGDLKNDKAFHSRRNGLRQYLASQNLTPEQRRQGLLRSGGRASKLSEVISIDEDWPQ
ncbi:uncharacterized protein TRIREDRAFT_111948 [Trichoderma reesei QM6a]|uniref:Predicted protein n=2 Tax=Hypocrea jecorina TaxID=51453 RepID=G0RVT8_HYPJQ|nr:uncharacterized protein TRIREDRAFT_111948 [Trichoderma reesei QM6a]EGR44727.1 predicted protein [Trichoderma reesei QM6a]ETR97563.1 hypothetical protein M419DRAFT_91140 [Trichoderma reesei RUT C-30]